MFDFIHTVLPTTLPLQEFYCEFAGLFGNALPARYRFGNLRRYGWRRGFRLLRKSSSMLEKIRNVHMDYARE